MVPIDEVIKELVLECYENLNRLDHDLLSLEEAPEDLELLASAFRSIHSIKGATGFLGIEQLSELTHAGENVLVPLRDGRRQLDRDTTDCLLRLVDAIRTLLNCAENGASENAAQYDDLMQQLRQIAQSPATATSPTNCERLSNSPAVAESKSQDAKPASTAPTAKAESRGSIADSKVRIDVTTLDNLMNLVSELVLARNQVLELNQRIDNSEFDLVSQRLSQITSLMQEEVSKTRMQPIGNAWCNLSRVVRDTSQACGKKVRVVTEGNETGLDKTVLEAIKDPLVHVVRNSVDHGIETLEERIAAGKPEQGVLSIRAFHEGGKVCIDISDDGRGIHRQRVQKKALQLGLVTEERLRGMTDRELVRLILLPGFSTASQVTQISGRGVGMDVVKTNIEAIGGTLDIDSTEGRGTTIRIKLPCSLAIVPALIISSGGQRFAIPQTHLVELLRVSAQDQAESLQRLCDSTVLRHRGVLLTLVQLDQALALEPLAVPQKVLEPAAEDEDRGLYVVVLQAGNRQFGLVVDEIIDAREIVVKPLHPLLQSNSRFAGATIIGDGRVVLILEVAEFAKQAGLSIDAATATQESQTIDVLAKESDPVLVVENANGESIGIMLSSVYRLESIPVESIERVEHRYVVQYRDRLMYLQGIDANNGMSDLSELWHDRSAIEVVVVEHDGHCLGLVVEHIRDIAASREDRSSTGSAMVKVIDDRVTRIIDPMVSLQIQQLMQEGSAFRALA